MANFLCPAKKKATQKQFQQDMGVTENGVYLAILVNKEKHSPTGMGSPLNTTQFTPEKSRHWPITVTHVLRVGVARNFPINQWELQDPHLEVGYGTVAFFRPFFGKNLPWACILGLIFW